MMKKDLKYQKKIYVPPIIEFEEIEEEEIDWLLAGSDNTGGGGNLNPGIGTNPNPVEEESLDLDFTLDMDFVINDEPQL